MKQNEYQQDEQQILHKQQKQVQHPELDNNNVPKIYIVMVVIALVMFVSTSMVNVYIRLGFGKGQEQGSGDVGVSLDDVQYEVVKDYMSTQQWRNRSVIKTDFGLSPIPANTTQRLSYGAPTPILPKMRIITISKQNPPTTGTTCLLTNGIDIITNTTINTATTILSQSMYRKWIIILAREDKYSDRQWKGFLQSANKMKVNYKVVQKNVSVDADYQFITSNVQGCQLIVYTQHYFKISAQQSSRLTTTISTTQHQHQHYVMYTSTAEINNKKQQLPNLNQIKLEQLSSKQLNKYLFIFTVDFLSIITPFNYAYYARYTIEEIFIRPILIIVMSSSDGGIGVIQEVVYGFDVAFASSKEFSVYQVDTGGAKKSSRNSGKLPTCFVSYPLSPHIIDYDQLQQYFNSLINIIGIENTTIIINIPHISPLVYKTYNLIIPYSQKYNIRLRITTNKTTSSLSVYEAAYTYCPRHAVMVTSRHNVVFYRDFIVEVLKGMEVKYHYYFVAHDVHGGDTMDIGVPFKYYKRKFRQQLTNYQSHFMQLQVFKSDLFRMMYFWSLKCDQVDFYETQASFVIPLLQMVRLITGIITKPVFKVNKRVIGQLEREQMDNLKLYFEWDPIPFNKLYPIVFNSLENEAFKRNPRQKIPKIIHQVWLGNKQITPFQLKLQKSLIQANKDFQVLLWRDQNITVQQFPMTYALIQRVMQYQQFSNRSYSAPTVSLMRYELLYRMGGIYIDFKTEGKKPLNPFLKYQIFFIDIDYDPDHYIFPSNVGNGIMGARRNNYHLLLTLTQLISEEKFNFKAFNFPKIVGGYVLRKSLTTYEMFTQVGYGFQLFSQKPGTGKPNLCSLSEGPADPDQQRFKVANFLTGKIFTITLPCKFYKQAYLIMYKVLAGTWKVKKAAQPSNSFQKETHKKSKVNK